MPITAETVGTASDQEQLQMYLFFIILFPFFFQLCVFVTKDSNRNMGTGDMR